MIKNAADAGRILNQRQISVDKSTAIFDFAFVVYERMRKVERPAS